MFIQQATSNKLYLSTLALTRQANTKLSLAKLSWCRSLPRTHMCRAGAGGAPSVVPAEGPTANVPGMHAREAQRAHPGGHAYSYVCPWLLAS